jgi:hypothetical protein
MEAVETTLAEMHGRRDKIMGSQRFITQEIYTVKTFLLPSLDSMRPNGDTGERQLKNMDKHIRPSMNKELTVKTLPVEYHHSSWPDEGIPSASLIDRRKVLMIRSFAQMVLSRDNKIREAMKWFINNETDSREMRINPESNFLNRKNEHGQQGTTRNNSTGWTNTESMSKNEHYIEADQEQNGTEESRARI